MPAFGAAFGRRRNNGERVETPMEGRGGREYFSGGCWRSRVLPGINEFFYEKVIKVKADVAALLTVHCSLWLSPHFRRKFWVRIAQERRLAMRSTHSTPAFVCFPRIQSA